MRNKIFLYGLAILVFVSIFKYYSPDSIKFGKTLQAHHSQPDWSALSQKQQDILSPLKDDWQELSSDTRIIFLVLTKRILKLDTANREIFKAKVQSWNNLSPSDRVAEIKNYLGALKISDNKKIKSWSQYQDLNPDEKQLLERQAFQKKSS